MELDPNVERFISEHPNGATLEQIADALGVTHQAVNQMLRKALAKVRRGLNRRRIYRGSDILPDSPGS